MGDKGLSQTHQLRSIADGSGLFFRQLLWLSRLLRWHIVSLLQSFGSTSSPLVPAIGTSPGKIRCESTLTHLAVFIRSIYQANNVAIVFAVISFYVLDFALNGLQASLRNLLLDIAPPNQLNTGNAWHSRMTNAGNIVGYGFGELDNESPCISSSFHISGFLPLAKLPVIRLIKGSQFRRFCIICIVILVITVSITCVCHKEEERPRKEQSHR